MAAPSSAEKEADVPMTGTRTTRTTARATRWAHSGPNRRRDGGVVRSSARGSATRVTSEVSTAAGLGVSGSCFKSPCRQDDKAERPVMQTTTVVRTTQPVRRDVVAGAALGLVAFVAYLPGIGRSLDFDSAQTVGMFVKPGPPWDVFRRQAVFNNHPAFSFLEQLVRVATGRSDAATMRVLPILFGAAAVAVLTWYAARRHGLAAGLVAGGLLAANPTF